MSLRGGCPTQRRRDRAGRLREGAHEGPSRVRAVARRRDVTSHDAHARTRRYDRGAGGDTRRRRCIRGGVRGADRTTSKFPGRSGNSAGATGGCTRRAPSARPRPSRRARDDRRGCRTRGVAALCAGRGRGGAETGTGRTSRGPSQIRRRRVQLERVLGGRARGDARFTRARVGVGIGAREGSRGDARSRGFGEDARGPRRGCPTGGRRGESTEKVYGESTGSGVGSGVCGVRRRRRRARQGAHATRHQSA